MRRRGDRTIGYLHIDNLYKNQDVLMFKECYASEKIHGTSAHVKFSGQLSDQGIYSNYDLVFFSGGAKHEDFVKIFDEEVLARNFCSMGCTTVIVYGEAYGGKMQGMKETYGNELRFVVFDVKIGDRWLSMPKAEEIAKKLGLDFVPYKKIPTTISAVDAERDRESVQAIKNGMGPGHKREGVVLRPIEEMTKNNGKRVICKHKGEEFKETKTPRKVVSADELEVIKDAKMVCEEWVTEMRLTHVLQNFDEDVNIEDTGEVISEMVEDIRREAEGEIAWNKQVQKVISKETALMFKRRLQDRLNCHDNQD